MLCIPSHYSWQISWFCSRNCESVDSLRHTFSDCLPANNTLIDERYALYIKPLSNDCSWKYRKTHEHDGRTHFQGSLLYDWRILKVHKDRIKFVQLNGRPHLISRELHVQAEMQSRKYPSNLQVHRGDCFHKVEQCMNMKMRLRHCEKWLIQLPFYDSCDINLCHQHGTWKHNCSRLLCFILCL